MKSGLRDCRGSVLMETVIVMPILLLLVFGILQFALCWTARQMTVYAAFCAARAITVISPRDNVHLAVQNAAKIVLSWMCTVDRGERTDVSIPGWGRIDGSGSVNSRVTARICTYRHGGVERYADGNGTPVIPTEGDFGDDRHHFAAARVTFRYPLIIPGMAVNRIIGRVAGGQVTSNRNADFYGDLARASANPNDDGYGCPFMTFTETCVLPMPYSTRNFPLGGFGTALSSREVR